MARVQAGTARPNSAEHPDDDDSYGKKRRRVAVACDTCRSRKSRCDGTRPRCISCTTNRLDCKYSNAGPLTSTEASRGHLDSLDSRLQSVETLLQELSGRVDRIGGTDNRLSVASPGSDEDNQERQQHDSNADSIDTADGVGSIALTEEKDSGFFGPSSNIAFVRLILKATSAVLKGQSIDVVPYVAGEEQRRTSHILSVSRVSSPTRGSSYAAAVHHGHSDARNYLSIDQRGTTLQLVENYFGNAGLLFPYIRRETFLATFHAAAAVNFRDVRRSWLGLLNLILAMSISTSSPSEIPYEQRKIKSRIYFRQAMDLCEGEIRVATGLEIVQFLLLMAQYLQGTESSIQTWNIHGLAVKAAYQLGLHSKHVLDRHDPIERETRVRTWYGCIMLDRTLSMTLGRPCCIPEAHVRVGLPAKVGGETPFSENDPGGLLEDASLQFFNSTISLYAILERVIDLLYDGNLACDPPQSVFETASQVLQIEHQLAEAEFGFAGQLKLLKVTDLVDDQSFAEGPCEVLRLRVILTLRYCNVRILAHRPLIHSYLDAIRRPAEDGQSSNMLWQVGSNSLRTCARSATTIIELVAHMLKAQENSQSLLGAWWFTLFYTFNAALALYSCLLIQKCACSNRSAAPWDPIEMDRSLMTKATDCLRSLDRGNKVVERCARFTAKLEGVLEALYSDREPRVGNASSSASRTARDGLGEADDTSWSETIDSESASLLLGLSDTTMQGDRDFLYGYDIRMNGF